MNWRRGLLLAGINLTVAVSMILMMEARDQKYALTQEEIMAKGAPRPPEPPTPKPAPASPEQAEETVSFDPCGCGFTIRSRLLWCKQPICRPSHWPGGGCLPSALVTCGETTRKKDLAANAIVVGNAAQDRCRPVPVHRHSVVSHGRLPLVRTRKWWADPGSFITACAVLAGATALIPVIDEVARLPALIAMLAWLWWFGLLVWKTLQFGWRMITAWRVPRSS